MRWPNKQKAPAASVRPADLFLVLDDLAMELPGHPIHVPIPPAALADEAALKSFTMQVLRDLMRLPYFQWTQPVENVVVDGFSLLHKNVYPSFST